LADELGVTNVRFEQGDVYALPFAAATFDAAFSRSVLEHLARPLEALREVRRVLKPGGVIGLTEGDFGGYVFAPHRPLVAEAVALYLRAWEHNGGNPRRGRELRALLREAGFGRVEATAGTPEVKGTPAATRECGELVAGLLTRPTFVDQMNRLGWADRQRLDQMAAALREWGEHPDAFWAVLRCKAIGRAE
jgi:SAM-dependent methyltransferase